MSLPQPIDIARQVRNGWIEIESGKRQVASDFGIGPDETRIIFPWSNQIPHTRLRGNLLLTRPIIEGHKEYRVCKDLAQVFKLTNHVRPFDIRGPYTGLLAANIAETLVLFHGHITGKLTSFQINEEDYKLVAKYVKKVRLAFPKREFGVHIGVRHNDIYQGMLEFDQDQAIIEMDAMGNLNDTTIWRTAAAVNKAAARRCALSVWHSSGHGVTDKELTEVYRPELRRCLERNFNILAESKLSYWETTPMRVDMFTLERKAA